MNVYRIINDGDERLFKAESYAGAVDAAYDQYIEENNEDRELAREYFESLLEQVVNLGELENDGVT